MSEKYIYESPDGGKTVYRRSIGDTKKERVYDYNTYQGDINYEIILKRAYAEPCEQYELELESKDQDHIWIIDLDLMNPEVKRKISIDTIQRIKYTRGK
jgi:hypothetical protein